MASAAHVSMPQMLTIAGGAVGIVLALSGSCDKAIETRITSIRQLSLSEHQSFDKRIDILERWRDRAEGKKKP